ncbi:hypothetical protein [Natronomonas sp.]|uniref:hypothetical protein n=1 Tax=Natronomonas sp. TaxID=2184060 RepID=UPI002FC32A4D
MTTQQTTTPELPTLETGIHLLEAEKNTNGPLQSLVLDHLLTTSGRANWVDAKGHATTTALARLAPSPRLLERVRVARGFTAYQHHELIQRVDRNIDDETNLLVCPALDALYRDTDHGDGEQLFRATLDRLESFAETAELTVLVTRSCADSFSDPLVSASQQRLRCTRTQFGPRFVGPDFETLVYPGDGYVQTTLAFWERVLLERQAAVSPSREVTAVGSY